MTDDQIENSAPRKPVRHGGGGHIVVGVLGACVLGAGLGFWARPGEPGAVAKPAAAPAAKAPLTGSLQIVVDERPAPMSQPLQVLPADAAGPANAAPPALAPPLAAPPVLVEPVVPRRPPNGLMKVDAPVQSVAVQPARVAEALLPPEKPRPDPAVKARQAEAEARLARAKTAEAREQKAEAARLEKAEAARLEKAEAVRLAKVERARAEKQALAEKTEKAERDKAAKLAKAEAAREKHPDAKPVRLASLLKAVKAAPKAIAAEARQATHRKPVELAQKAEPKADPRPPVRAAKPKPALAAAPPAKTAAPPRGEGPLRMARATLCASDDPGEALVCSDRQLNARDRQMQQAYRNAEAAGVPAAALRRQQDRWRQARAAAAREAPWAVEDVYEARISELNDLSRGAREN